MASNPQALPGRPSSGSQACGPCVWRACAPRSRPPARQLQRRGSSSAPQGGSSTTLSKSLPTSLHLTHCASRADGELCHGLAPLPAESAIFACEASSVHASHKPSPATPSRFAAKCARSTSWVPLQLRDSLCQVRPLVRLHAPARHTGASASAGPQQTLELAVALPAPTVQGALRMDCPSPHMPSGTSCHRRGRPSMCCTGSRTCPWVSACRIRRIDRLLWHAIW